MTNGRKLLSDREAFPLETVSCTTEQDKSFTPDTETSQYRGPPCGQRSPQDTSTAPNIAETQNVEYSGYFEGRPCLSSTKAFCQVSSTQSASDTARQNLKQDLELNDWIARKKQRTRERQRSRKRRGRQMARLFAIMILHLCQLKQLQRTSYRLTRDVSKRLLQLKQVEAARRQQSGHPLRADVMSRAQHWKLKRPGSSRKPR